MRTRNSLIGYFLLGLLLSDLLLAPTHTQAADMAVSACPEGGVVQFVDLETKTVVDEVAVGLFPFDVVVDPSGIYAYVTGCFSFDVTVLNIRTKQIEKTIPVGFVPTCLNITPDGSKLLVSNSVSGAPQMEDIVIIDTASRKVIGMIDTQLSPVDIAITHDGKKAIISHPFAGNVFTNGLISVVDIDAASVLHTIPLQLVPSGIAIAPNSHYCYVSNTLSSSISVVDLTLTPPAIVTNVVLGMLYGPTDLVVTKNAKKLLVACSAADQVAVLDLADPSHPTLEGYVVVGSTPAGLALTPDGNSALIANIIGNSYSLLTDLTNDPEVLATIPAGDVAPRGVAIVPKSVSTIVEFLPAESLPIDYKTLAPYASVDLHYNITENLATVTEAYLELSFYDLDWTNEAKVLVNGSKVALPMELVANDGWRTARLVINKGLLLAGANVVTVEDAKNWPKRFILGSAKILVAVPATMAQSNQKALGKRIEMTTIPLDLQLFNNFPNPFNPTTEIQFNVPNDTHVVISIVNMAGQKVRTLIDSEVPAGQHVVIWNGEDDAGQKVASGTYLYTLESDEAVLSKRMLLMK